MVPSMWSGAARAFGARVSLRVLFACVFLGAVPIATCAPVRAEEAKSCVLSFALPDSLLLHYKTFNQTNQNFRGSDVTFNETAEVDMIAAGKDEKGQSKVSIKFKKVTTSLVNNNQLMDWEPPIKLEGATVIATVSRADEVISFAPSGSVSGLKNADELRDVIEAFFIRLPDTTVTLGQTWTQKIVKGEKEGQPPDVKGEAVFTLKKIEKKGKLTIAIVEGKGAFKINRDTAAGVLVAESKIDVKAQLAVDGGYIVELKETMEIKGTTIATDPLTDKETKQATTVSRYFECKLQQ